MKISQVAAQLYTIREFVKTPADIATSLKKIREIGFEAVQVSGIGPIEESELLQILQGEGLTLCATHEGAQSIIDNPHKVVERLQSLKCTYTAYPHPAGVDFTEGSQITAMIHGLDKAGKVLRDAGIVLAYHNHAIELAKVGGKTILDHIYDSTDPTALQGEIDTYWIQAGGGDPVQWCEKLAGRLPLLHLKDYAMTLENKPRFAEIGYGNLDWKRIIPAAEKSGCKWFIIEQDTCPGNPFDSLKMSFDYIKANLIN
jgi:sugar phosphate isomerase/epimerase